MEIFPDGAGAKRIVMLAGRCELSGERPMRIFATSPPRQQGVQYLSDSSSGNVAHAHFRSTSRSLPGCRMCFIVVCPRGSSPTEGKRTANRHLSPRTIERTVEKARVLSGITKHTTPHSMRHSFATHLIESGTDIRFIQKLLGHTHLETTSLYTKVAITTTSNVSSPFDQMQNAATEATTPSAAALSTPSVGKLKIVVEDPPDATGNRRVYLGILSPADRSLRVDAGLVSGVASKEMPVSLPGIVILPARWFCRSIVPQAIRVYLRPFAVPTFALVCAVGLHVVWDGESFRSSSS
jgi:hypothetical protein